MNIRLIIFDFDGTLCDTHGVIVATVLQTLQELHLPVATEEAITATIGLPLRECYRHYVPQLDEATLDACEDTHHRLFDINRRRIKPEVFPHVRESLLWLHEHGIKATVASSRTSFSLHELLSDLGLEQSFDYVLGAEDVVRPKPEPEPVLKTLAALDVSAAEALVVGDMPVDILMGRNAGTRTCGVTYGNASRQQLEEAGADFVIDDMEELINTIRK